MINANPHLTEEMAEYLVANDYQMAFGRPRTIFFTNGEYKLVFFNDTLDVFSHDTGEPEQRRPGMFLIHSFSGISQLNFFNFMLLIHITGAIPLKEFIARAKRSQLAVDNSGNISCVQLAEHVLQQFP